jgi:hypothetical protein
MKAKLWKGSYHWDKKRGAARKEDLRGITWCCLNQPVTGTRLVSSNPVMVFEMESREHIWECPDCDDANPFIIYPGSVNPSTKSQLLKF